MNHFFRVIISQAAYALLPDLGMQSPDHQGLVHCTLTATSDDTRARWIEAGSRRAAVKAQEAAHLLTLLASTSLVSILAWPNHFSFAFLLWLAPVNHPR